MDIRNINVGWVSIVLQISVGLSVEYVDIHVDIHSNVRLSMWMSMSGSLDQESCPRLVLSLIH